jgi:hypothetical protein
MPADVALNIDISKQGEGDKAAAAGLELVAKAADDAKDELAQLDRKLLETRAAMAGAARVFNETGDISPFRSLVKDQGQLNTVRRNLLGLSGDADRAAKGIKEAFEQAVSDKKSGIFGFFKGGSISNALIPQMQATGLQAGSAFGGGFRSALGAFVGPLALAIGPPLVAAIGADISAFALGGLGLSAIAAGVALQFHSAVVQRAVGDMGSYVKQQLMDATEGFGPQFAQGLQALRRESEPFWGSLKAGLQSLEPYVGNLLARLGEGLAKLGPGLQHALEAAGPILGAISRNLPTLLNAIGIFFDEISKGSKGASEGVSTLIKAFSAMIVVAGVGLRGLANVFDFMAQSGAKVTRLFADFFGALAKIPGASLALKGIAAAWGEIAKYDESIAKGFEQDKLAADTTSGAFHGLAGSAGEASGAMQGLQRSSQELFGQFMSVDQATIGFKAALTSLNDAIGSNGTTLDTSTAKGQANAQALLGAAQAAEQQREAMIASGQSTAYANDIYDQNIDALVRDAVQHGLTGRAVEDLIGKYRSVPGEVVTPFLTPGLLDAIGNAHSLAGAIAAVPGSKTSTITTIYRTLRYESVFNSVGKPGEAVPFARGGIWPGLRAATGLIADRPMLVGERTVPEAAIPAPNSGISQARADTLLGTAAAWWGRRLAPAGGGGGGPAGPMVLELTSDGGSAADLVLELLRQSVKIRGGNVQIVVAGKAAQ